MCYTIRDHNTFKAATSIKSTAINSSYALRQDHVAHAAHPVDLVGAAVNILGQGDGILVPKIFNQAIGIIFLDEAESICRVHVLPRGNTVAVDFVPIFIHDQLGVTSNLAVLLGSNGQR